MFLGTVTMVVCLKHVGIRLGQGEFENVSEDTCQLVRACLEHTDQLASVFTDIVKLSLSESEIPTCFK